MNIVTRRANAKKGFTLIEVLTVIAIIGILSAIVMLSVSSSQKKGRDGRRISDINQIRLALSLYYDANNSYPSGNGTTAGTLGVLQTGNFIANLPNDPMSGGTNNYGYRATPSGCSGSSCSGYILLADLEATNAILTTSYSPAAGSTFSINGANNQDCNGSNATGGKTVTGTGGVTYYIYCASQ